MDNLLHSLISALEAEHKQRVLKHMLHFKEECEVCRYIEDAKRDWWEMRYEDA